MLATGNSPIAFDNSYAQLPDRFFVRQSPVPVTKPGMIRVNKKLAAELGLDLDEWSDAELAEIFTGNSLPTGAEPLAMAYAGHQFGGFVPQLGDGRAVLLGEVLDQNGSRVDLQLKGAGQTPFSRNGDGRAWLGPVLREYVVSEAMAALGVPTTRALAAATTGDIVYRETALPGAVLTRVAASHVRVGTFQYFAARQDFEALQTLTDYVIARHYPDIAGADNRPVALLEAVIARQAQLVARWMGLGFIHGVMNTDNMSIAGETIDYGPCAFMDRYHPDTVFSSIDRQGRYAYSNQPLAAQWNLAQLATALLPLIDPNQEKAVELATVSIDQFMPAYEEAWLTEFRGKIGLDTQQNSDRDLITNLLALMASGGADFTQTFRALSEFDPNSDAAAELALVEAWLPHWHARLAEEDRGTVDIQKDMRRINPAIIPRNHQVEAIIQAALGGDYAPFEQFNAALADPFEADSNSTYRRAPAADQIVQATFCGT